MSTCLIRNLALTSCLVALFVTSCCILTKDTSQCPIEDLLIKASDLPGDQWEEVGSRSYRDAPSKLGIERIGTGFSTPYDGISEENVYRFSSESDTTDGFYKLADLWHCLEPEGTVWSQLVLPSNRTLAANEYRIECSVSPQLSLRTCWYIARYGKTVIEFRTAMIIINDNDFFNIINLLDQRVVNCGKS
jgi:hypothetical protein